MYERDIEDIIHKVNILEHAYDKIRIVDPTRKTVFNLTDNGSESLPGNCYDFWNKGQICSNCISMKAYQEKDTFIKLEYSESDVYMVTAIPIELTDRTVVLEFLKNATHNIIVVGMDGENGGDDFHAMIDTLNELAIKDSLTGIYNRRYINEKLPLDLINASLSDYSISIIMVDIDLFKKVNDTYGHLIGDCVLKGLANTLKQCLKRENDWVARYGGEEFLICLPGAPLSFAEKLAEKIRRKIENAPINCGELTVSITASFGVASVTPKHGTTVEELIENADKKLYDAKRNGRNRVEV